MAHVRQQIVEAVISTLENEFDADTVHGLTYFEQPSPRGLAIYVEYGEEEITESVQDPNTTWTYERQLEIAVTIVQPINRSSNPFANEDAQVRVERAIGQDSYLNGVLDLPVRMTGTEVIPATGDARLLANVLTFICVYNTSAVNPDTN